MKQIAPFVLAFLFLHISPLSAQTQSWQWIKAGGSSNDNNGSPTASCKISGCDAKGNVYALSAINGSSMLFDTFQSPGTIGSNGTNQLIFSYDCSGNMRWAKQVGDIVGFGGNDLPGIVTDIHGNTYFSNVFDRGFMIGDTAIDASLAPNFYIYMFKLDSLGKIVWVKNYGNVASNSYSNGRSQGMRIGSSSNIWMICYLDSNFSLAPTFHATKAGNYQIELDPNTGNILGGYYVSNTISSDYSLDTKYDIDENENFYRLGSLSSAQRGVGPGDTLRLNGHTFAPDSNLGLGSYYIYSLDKQGNFRYYITNSRTKTNANPYTCRYDLQNHRLVSTLGMDSGVVFQADTVKYNFLQLYTALDGFPFGIYSISPGGNSLYCKYVTHGEGSIGQIVNVLTANYISTTPSACSYIYDSVYHFVIGDTTNLFSSDYYRVIQKIDKDGNILSSYTANLGAANTTAGDGVSSGAADWRGNLYMGGSITNYMALPNGDSVSNTDATSGNFFIAKIGISDCSCPTPGAQFTQVAHGDTLAFMGSSTNHRDSIHWEFGDGSTATTDTFTHLYAHDGTYTVTAIAYSGCGVDSITKQIVVNSTGIAIIEPEKTQLYPNPAARSISLSVSNAAKIGMVAANGTSMWDVPVQVVQSGTYVFDISRYANSMYYFIVEYTNGKVEVLPVIKK